MSHRQKADKDKDVLSRRSASTHERSMAADYMLYHMKNSEVIKYPCSCRYVMPYCEVRGELLLTETRITFAADESRAMTLLAVHMLMQADQQIMHSWSYEHVSELHARRYMLKDVGIELFLIFGQTILLAFRDTAERDSVADCIRATCARKRAAKLSSGFVNQQQQHNFN